MLTMSWSRSRGDSSRSPISAITNTTSPAMPQMRYSWVQNRGSWLAETSTGTVFVATTETIRLPTTGPLVQKPMAVPRPSCGEKSRISAGVATRHMPSTNPTTQPTMTKNHLFVASGSMKATATPVNSSPKTTRLARPYRSPSPATSEPNAPIRAPKARVTTKNVKLMCRLARSSVAHASLAMFVRPGS